MTKTPKLDDTKRLMGALVRMKPKAHEEMKLGRKTAPSKPRARKNKRT